MSARTIRVDSLDLPFSMLSIRNGVPNDVLKEDLEYPPRLLINET